MAFEKEKKNSSFGFSKKSFYIRWSKGKKYKCDGKDGDKIAWLLMPGPGDMARTQQKEAQSSKWRGKERGERGRETVAGKSIMPPPPPLSNLHLNLHGKPEVFLQKRFKFIILLLWEPPNQEITSSTMKISGREIPNPLWNSSRNCGYQEISLPFNHSLPQQRHLPFSPVFRKDWRQCLAGWLTFAQIPLKAEVPFIGQHH